MAEGRTDQDVEASQDEQEGQEVRRSGCHRHHRGRADGLAAAVHPVRKAATWRDVHAHCRARTIIQLIEDMSTSLRQHNHRPRQHRRSAGLNPSGTPSLPHLAGCFPTFSIRSTTTTTSPPSRASSGRWPMRWKTGRIIEAGSWNSGRGRRRLCSLLGGLLQGPGLGHWPTGTVLDRSAVLNGSTRER